MHRYEVGQLYHPDRTRWPEAVEYAYRGGGHQLLLFMRRPSSREIEAIRKGPAEFAVYVEGDVLLLLYRFRTPKLELAIDWSDAPFTIHREPEESRTVPPDEAGHALLSVTLVDAETGVIRAMRQATFSPEFTATIHQAIREQAARPWDAAGYERELRRIYARHQSSHELVPLAIARTRGGE